MKLKIIIRMDENTGKPYLYFPLRSTSDTHLGTNASKARGLCMAQRNIRAGREQYPGDIVSADELPYKKTWHVGPHQRQVMGNILRAAGEEDVESTINDGNHDPWFDKHPGLEGKTLYGLKFEQETKIVTPRGLVIGAKHGDQFEEDIYESPEAQLRAYQKGAKWLRAANRVNAIKNALGIYPSKNFAAISKKALKRHIDNKQGVKDVVKGFVDASDYDVFIYGHTHMASFFLTDGNNAQGKPKLVINDGCCTEYVQFVVFDDQDTPAILEYHYDRLIVKEFDWETGKEVDTALPWNDSSLWQGHDMSHFGETPDLIEDQYTGYADNLCRVIARDFPAKDRQLALEQMRQARQALKKNPDDEDLQQKFDWALANRARKISIPKYRPPAAQPVETVEVQI